jgi:hypothetical protein
MLTLQTNIGMPKWDSPNRKSDAPLLAQCHNETVLSVTSQSSNPFDENVV